MNKKKTLKFSNKNDQSKVSPLQPQKKSDDSQAFSLRNLNPSQMKELNTLLESYVEVPRASSLPKYKYIPTPPGSITSENYEEFQFMIAELYKGSRYEFDTNDYEKQRG